MAALLASAVIVHHALARSRANNLLALLHSAAPRPASSEAQAATLAAPPPGLTGPEWQLLRLIGEQHSNEQIASAPFVSVATVKTHINRVYSKLSIGSREEAKQRARHLGG